MYVPHTSNVACTTQQLLCTMYIVFLSTCTIYLQTVGPSSLQQLFCNPNDSTGPIQVIEGVRSYVGDALKQRTVSMGLAPIRPVSTIATWFQTFAAFKLLKGVLNWRKSCTEDSQSSNTKWRGPRSRDHLAHPTPSVTTCTYYMYYVLCSTVCVVNITQGPIED